MIVDILNAVIKQLDDPKVLALLSKKTGMKPSQVKQLAGEGLPVLLGAFQKNASTAEGAKALDKALEEHKDDQVDNVFSFLSSVDTKDGGKILKHAFSSDIDRVEADLAGKAGVEKSQADNLLTQLAPLVLGALGNQKKTQTGQVNVNDMIGTLVSGFLKKM